MKKDNSKLKEIGLWAAMAVVVAVGLWFQFGGESGPERADDQKSKARLIAAKRADAKARFNAKHGGGKHTEKTRISREKPRLLELDDDDEAKLNAFSRSILNELQEALDSENFAIVSRLAAKMMEIPPDPKFGKDGVAALLRRKAIEALGWFGADALPELVGMLGDADPDIAQETFDQFSLALEDISLSDYERADIVVMAARVLTNVDNLEMLFMEINSMRPSVGCSALTQICLEGTEAAKSLMPDAIELFTGEDNIRTVEDMEQWLEKNPDGEYDDELYGGDKGQ